MVGFATNISTSDVGQIYRNHSMSDWLPEESVLKNPLREVERLSTKVVPTLHRDIIALQSRLTAAEKERDEARARVKKLEQLSEYVNHLTFCRLTQGRFFNPQLGCTCGLDELRNELDKLKGNK